MVVGYGHGDGAIGNWGVGDFAVDYGTGDTSAAGDIPLPDYGGNTADNSAGDFTGDWGVGDYTMGDYGPGDTAGPGDNGVDDVADYGALDMGDVVGDDGGDSGVADYGDYGKVDLGDFGIDGADFGTTDAGETGPANDGAVDGPGGDDWGYGVDGPGDDAGTGDILVVQPGPPVSIRVEDAEAWEGPYSLDHLDEAKFILEKPSNNSNYASVLLRFTGTATPGVDYIVKDHWGNSLPLREQLDGSQHASIGFPDLTMNFTIVTLMDNDYEPEETIVVTVIDTSDHPPGSQVGDSAEATAVIIDKTADLDVANLSDVKEVNPGAHLKRNDDDDNGNGLPDYLDTPLTISDDDLVTLTITPHLQEPNDFAPYIWISENAVIPTISYFVLDFDATKLRIFKMNGEEVLSSETPFRDEGSTSLLLEGNGLGGGTISLVWRVDVANQAGNGGTLLNQTFDTIKYMVWGVDLDIDSDNEDGFNEPDHSQWEEYIEADNHAIGKMLTVGDAEFTPMTLQLPPGLDPNDTQILIDIDPVHGGTFWSGEVRLWNTRKSSPRDARFWYEGGNQLAFSGNSLNALRYDSATGKATVWVEAISVNESHDTKREVDVFGKPDDRFSVELTGVPGMTLKDEVKYMVVNPDSFYPTLNSGQEFRDAFAAEMVYGVRDANGGSDASAAPIDDKRWALRLLKRDELERLLRTGLADYPQEADEWDYLEIILDNVFPDRSSTSRKVPGFNVAVYLDYCSGNLVVSFRGTNFKQLIDWIANIAQGASGFSEQHRAAQQISVGMLRFAASAWNSIYGVGTSVNTGHSLGGGLASAGAIASGTHANTFNAAGLYGKDTFKDPDTGEFWYPGSDTRYDNATTYVTAWKIVQMKYAINESRFSAPDVLSWLQDTVNFSALGRPDVLPSAIGVPQAREGLHELTAGELTALTVLKDLVSQDLGEWGWTKWLSFLDKLLPLILEANADITWESLWDWLVEHDILAVDVEVGVDLSVFQGLAAKMAESHAMEHVYHGLFTRRSTVTGNYLWDVYH